MTAAREAAAVVAAEANLHFDLVNMDRRAPTGVEPIPAAPDFHDIALFNNRIYLSGAAGLITYDSDAVNATTWRAGIELPPAELGAMAVVSLRGSVSNELLIATDTAGVLRFDGSRFRQLFPSRPELRRVTALLALGTGRVLIGTETAGVAVYDGETLTMLDARLAVEHITALAGSDQDLWIGTLLDGAWHLHAGQIEQIKDALPDPQVLSLAVHNDLAYVGTPLGAVEFQSGRKVRMLADGTFARALFTSADRIAIGTEDEGLFDVPLLGRSRSIPIETALAGDRIQRILDLGGTTYCLTPKNVFRKSKSQWEPLVQPGKNLLTDRHIAALSVSSEGNLWVGFFDRGLDILSGNRQAFNHFEDDHLFCVNRIVSDGVRTAVATANGLVMFGGEEVRQVLGRKDGLIADHITDVAFKNGGLIAATPAGISFVDSTGVRSLYVFQGLVNNHVYALGLAGDQLLAGTLGGVSVLDHEVIRANYTTANSGLKHNWITALVRVGDDWFAGTYGAGVLRLDPHGVWHTFPDLNTRFVVNPGTLLLANGRVYAGSLDRGLYIYDLNLGRWRNTVAGLPSLNVTALASSSSDIYVGTANGIVRFEEQALR